MSWPARPVAVRVPATSANLGPGYDAVGLALGLYDAVEARIIPDGVAIEVSGAGEATAAAGEDHLVIRAMRAAFGVLGGQPPGIGLRCANAIPQGYGLGSSAGAIVAGLLAARALAAGAVGRACAQRAGPGRDGPGLTDAELLQLATRLEGHPDNVAACLAGGLTIAWASDRGARAARLTPVAGLTPVLCVPEIPLSTAHARGLLPAAVPHADAVANSARAALLIAALTSDPALLMAGTEDYLHQPYRAPAAPATADLVGRLRAAGIPAVVSGAGPSVLALTVAGLHPGPEAVRPIADGTGTAWQVRVLEVDRDGAAVQAVPTGSRPAG
ncbi:MAG TPA: homoserine kinase [Streptosporangiaceae bacterium]|nr:homoserine kinase [Streptosporangiaceae bacterium]